MTSNTASQAASIHNDTTASSMERSAFRLDSWLKQEAPGTLTLRLGSSSPSYSAKRSFTGVSEDTGGVDDDDDDDTTLLLFPQEELSANYSYKKRRMGPLIAAKPLVLLNGQTVDPKVWRSLNPAPPSMTDKLGNVFTSPNAAGEDRFYSGA